MNKKEINNFKNIIKNIKIKFMLFIKVFIKIIKKKILKINFTIYKNKTL